MSKAIVKFKESTMFWMVLFSIVYLSVGNEDLNPRLIQIWGPGLEPQNIPLPAHYFFIHVPNYNGSILDKFDIMIVGETEDIKPYRVWHNILGGKDGSLIVRYKINNNFLRLEINVKYQNQHVAESPYLIEDFIYPDHCYCPKDNINLALHSYDCKAVPAQINSDFKPFQKIDWDMIRPKLIQQFDKPHSVSLCHYVIKENKIYRKCYGKYVGFNRFSDRILLSLTRKAKLPDLEFFVNLGDWPLSAQNLEEKFPIFSWCGSTDTNDIVMPTYELTESVLENMGRVLLDMLSVQGNGQYKVIPWDQREPKLFWRGRDSSRRRLELIKLSRKHPDLINASLTDFFFYGDEVNIYGPRTDRVSFFRFFEYKYQLAIDGTVAPYRTPFLLGGGSLIFKPESKYYEHFYSDLKPNTHYIPVESDLSDLVEKIRWAIKNDREAHQIAQNGQIFANENLLPQHVFCYYFHLLNELRKKIYSEVRVLDGMELVTEEDMFPCDCLKASRLKKYEL